MCKYRRGHICTVECSNRSSGQVKLFLKKDDDIDDDDDDDDGDNMCITLCLMNGKKQKNDTAMLVVLSFYRRNIFSKEAQECWVHLKQKYCDPIWFLECTVK